MAQGDVFLTEQGSLELKAEYKQLKEVRRPEFSKAIEKAREMGDLRENAEYDAAKEAQALNERRIAELGDILSRVRLLKDENIDKNKAFVGAKVKLKDLSDQEEEVYLLVSEAESDFKKSKISVTSPLGKGLLGHKKGDMIEVNVPAGIIKYEIIDVTR
ncbi:MAG: transcription elongation factor GreA [Candidatus Omnitrophota bacterium]|nr:MAG: transcription elongation factor GreA [Candidatus Omnitrophota bacterium]